MTGLNILLALGIFASTLFLLIRYGGVYFRLTLALLLIALVAVSIKEIFFYETSDNFSYPFPWMMFAWFSAYFISIPFQKKKAGNLITTTKISAKDMFWRLISITVVIYVAYVMLIPDEYSYQDRGDGYLRMELSKAILLIVIVGFYALRIFRKSEFCENGILDSLVGYLSWEGYKAYEWVGYTKNNMKQFLLYLEGGRNETISIDFISGQDKIILEELLSKKLPQIKETT